MFVSTELYAVCSCSKRQHGENQEYAVVSQSKLGAKRKTDPYFGGSHTGREGKLSRVTTTCTKIPIPLRAHPQTKPQTKTVFFTKTPSTEPAPWAIVESAGAATECTRPESEPPRKRSVKKKQYMVPDKTESLVHGFLQ